MRVFHRACSWVVLGVGFGSAVRSRIPSTLNVCNLRVILGSRVLLSCIGVGFGLIGRRGGGVGGTRRQAFAGTAATA